ncbi:MAG TPA: zinc ribbon domain-containing protein [Chitinophagaceae bacterium]
MENRNFCQSCSMPLDKPELAGTEKDGSKSKEYCVYCYQNGAFLNPGMTLNEMKNLVKEQMEKRKMDASIINRAVNGLPDLKRWRKKEFSL